MNQMVTRRKFDIKSYIKKNLKNSLVARLQIHLIIIPISQSDTQFAIHSIANYSEYMGNKIGTSVSNMSEFTGSFTTTIALPNIERWGR